MSQAGGDPKRLQRATAQPDGHAVVVGEGFFLLLLLTDMYFIFLL